MPVVLVLHFDTISSSVLIADRELSAHGKQMCGFADPDVIAHNMLLS
jgi:hypothetical protein